MNEYGLEMTGAPDTALESCTHRGFIRENEAYRGGTAFTTPSVLGQGAFFTGGSYGYWTKSI